MQEFIFRLVLETDLPNKMLGSIFLNQIFIKVNTRKKRKISQINETLLCDLIASFTQGMWEQILRTFSSFQEEKFWLEKLRFQSFVQRFTSVKYNFFYKIFINDIKFEKKCMPQLIYFRDRKVSEIINCTF